MVYFMGVLFDYDNRRVVIPNKGAILMKTLAATNHPLYTWVKIFRKSKMRY